jgi:hypothetical protein
MNQAPSTDRCHCHTFYYPSRQQLDGRTLCQQAAGELLPDGIISIRDVVVPGSRLRGKKANLQREAGQYVNTFLAYSGLGYGRGLSQPQWEEILFQAGFQIVISHTEAQTIDFQQWILPAKLPAGRVIRLKALLIQAPTLALEYLTPQIGADRITFQIYEIFIVGRLSGNQ